MGFFSNLFSNPDTLPLLSDDEISMIVLFFERGWANETRRVFGMNGGLNDIANYYDDRSIVKGLKKRFLTADEMEVVIKLLEADMSYRGEDEDQKQIISKLKKCKAKLG